MTNDEVEAVARAMATARGIVPDQPYARNHSYFEQGWKAFAVEARQHIVAQDALNAHRSEKMIAIPDHPLNKRREE